ncbi:biotin--[acetyl-CoA-carboxylase] ligase [Acidobacteriota bacterium]
MKCCPSTNDLAKELARKGAVEGTVIISQEQTKGRGTKGREWFSAPGKGLYLSIILRPPNANISLIPLVAGLAASDAVFKSECIRALLLWPNDLVWAGKKLGGILCETVFSGNRLNCIILGIGLNLNHSRQDFPGDIRPYATSLKIITGEKVKKRPILENLWITLNHWYDLFLGGENEKIVNAMEKYSVFSPGKELTVLTEQERIIGVYSGIDLKGGLILEEGGIKRSFYSAEIASIQEK